MPDLTPLAPEPNNQPAAGFAPPPAQPAANNGANAAADVIRSKLDRIYANEPDAETELQEAEALTTRSKHQEFMHQLSNSGKDLATIQTEWHEYYIQLNDQEKHQVWQEFYSTSSTPKLVSAATPSEPASEASVTVQPQLAVSPHEVAEHKHEARNLPRYKAKSKRRDTRTPQAIRASIRNSVTANGKLTARHHVQSLLFGIGVAAVVVFVIMFTFFNEAFIAPFIQPSRVAAATPIIVDSNSVAPSKDPQVIIPKINVQIPVVYNLADNREETVQTALESGVAHYPTTALPGSKGNAAFFGHSSNNIFNKGKYKFAFVLLHQLVIGDTFYLAYEGKMYVYKVIKRVVVDPNQVEVLDAVPGKTATATLITCDPPGTSLKRLVVVGEQISPDPNTNTEAPEQPQELEASTVSLPGNGPTLAGRLLDTPIGKAFAIVVIIGALAITLRWVNKPSY